MEYWIEKWEFVKAQIGNMDLIDLLDIIAVTVLLYAVYRFIRGRRAGKLAIGVTVIVALQALSTLLGLNALRFIMENVFQVGLLALIIVFQPELRSALEKIGGEPLKSIKNIAEHKTTEANKRNIRELCDAVTELSDAKTGALIVLERTTKLGDVINTGVLINANLSSFLIRNIFYNKAPLHDGAMIVRDGRICAAGCFLPLSANDEIIQDLGTRHRAGIGMSENSDAVVIIVSEETGIISVAKDGQLKRNYNYASLKKMLERLGPEATGTKRIREASEQESPRA